MCLLQSFLHLLKQRIQFLLLAPLHVAGIPAAVSRVQDDCFDRALRAGFGGILSMGLTIRYVARHAGVSTATVSHVLNNTGQVIQGTREMVMSVVRELGYRCGAVNPFMWGH